MKLIRALLCAFLLTIISMPIIALASDITGAKFYGVIVVSNNSTATSNVATTANINSQVLIDGSHMNASGNNTVIRNAAGADVPFMPGYNATPWVMWVPSIGANSYLNYILYTADSSDGKVCYFPDDTGMSANDSGTLELGDNFTIEQKGWWDTTAVNATSINKTDAFYTVITASGNITSSIITWVSPTSATGNWTNEENIYDDNVTTYAQITLGGAGWSEFLPFLYPGGWLKDIRFYAWGSQPGTKLDLDAYYDGAWHNIFDADIEADENTWQTKSLSGYYFVREARIRIYLTAAGDCRLNEVDFGALSVTATAISSGNHTVKTDTYGIISGALHFDEVEPDSVDGGSDASLNVTEISIEFWFKTDAQATNAIASRREQGVDNLWQIGTFASMRLQWTIWVSGNVSTLDGDTTNITAGEWHYGAATYNSTHQRIYVDGIEDATPTVLSGNLDMGSSNLTFGRIYSDGNHPMEGAIDEFRMYDRALTPAEILNNYNAGVGSKVADNTTGLIVQYHFDEGTGTTTTDEQGNAEGTFVNTPTWVEGKVPSQLAIYVDGIEKDGTRAIPVTDNSENWTFCSGGSMPYLEYQKIWIGDTLTQHIEWQYSDSIFTDLSGNGHAATPTFRTATSNENVTANLTRFLPIAEAKAPAYTLSEAPPFITETPEIVAPFTTTPPEVTFPLQGVIAAIAEASGTPAQLPLLIIAGFIIVAISLSFSAFLRRYGSGSIFIKIIVITALMGVFLAIRGFGIDFWMIVIFLIITSGVAMASRPQGVT